MLILEDLLSKESKICFIKKQMSKKHENQTSVMISKLKYKNYLLKQSYDFKYCYIDAFNFLRRHLKKNANSRITMYIYLLRKAYTGT